MNLCYLASMNNIPFLENACCNEGEASTYFYFTNKEKSIEKYNERVKELARYMKNIQNYYTHLY